MGYYGGYWPGKIAKLNCFSLAKTLKIILPLYICKAFLSGGR